MSEPTLSTSILSTIFGEPINIFNIQLHAGISDTTSTFIRGWDITPYVKNTSPFDEIVRVSSGGVDSKITPVRAFLGYYNNNFDIWLIIREKTVVDVGEGAVDDYVVPLKSWLAFINSDRTWSDWAKIFGGE